MDHGTNEQILAAREKKSSFAVGQKVIVSDRQGDWGKGNRGTVVCVAAELDPKGRHFVGVRMDGMPRHRGAPECKQLVFLDAEDGLPPLPHFEAGLLKSAE